MQASELLRFSVPIHIELANLTKRLALKDYGFELGLYLFRSWQDALELTEEDLGTRFLIKLLYPVRNLFRLQSFDPLDEDFCGSVTNLVLFFTMPTERRTDTFFGLGIKNALQLSLPLSGC